MTARKSAGVALITTLLIGSVLFILAAGFLTHLREDFHSHRQRQWGVQAEWNARAAIEMYYMSRKLPEVSKETGLRTIALKEGSTAELCHVHKMSRGLKFEGQSHGVSRSLLVLQDGSGRIVRVLE